MTIKDGFNNGDSMYCYPDTMVLKNKWNIHDEDVLEKIESQAVALRIAEIFKSLYLGR